MLKILAWIELSLSIFSPALALCSWPGFGLCHGRPVGFDCESWFIFGVNIFAPLGLLAFVCSIWTLKKRTSVPQYMLVAGSVILMVYLFAHG
jgi:hypothetical protein